MQPRLVCLVGSVRPAATSGRSNRTDVKHSRSRPVTRRGAVKWWRPFASSNAAVRRCDNHRPWPEAGDGTRQGNITERCRPADRHDARLGGEHPGSTHRLAARFFRPDRAHGSLDLCALPPRGDTAQSPPEENTLPVTDCYSRSRSAPSSLGGCWPFTECSPKCVAKATPQRVARAAQPRSCATAAPSVAGILGGRTRSGRPRRCRR